MWLQVAAELGIFGLAAFCFLVSRAFYAVFQTRRLLRRRAAERRGPRRADDDELLDAHSAAMAASLAGWFVCAFFSSVAYNWTFYYLLVLAAAPREILRERIPPLPSACRPMRAARFPAAASSREGARMMRSLLTAPLDAAAPARPRDRAPPRPPPDPGRRPHAGELHDGGAGLSRHGGGPARGVLLHRQRRAEPAAGHLSRGAGRAS